MFRNMASAWTMLPRIPAAPVVDAAALVGCRGFEAAAGVEGRGFDWTAGSCPLPDDPPSPLLAVAGAAVEAAPRSSARAASLRARRRARRAAMLEEALDDELLEDGGRRRLAFSTFLWPRRMSRVPC